MNIFSFPVRTLSVQIGFLETFYLSLFAFLAGLVDSVAGGGGLIQLPALLIFLPAPAAAMLPAVLGTNKFSSMFGTAVAAGQYAQRVRIHWHSILPAGLAAFFFSFLGARTVSILTPGILKPTVLVLLLLVAVYTARRRDLGSLHLPQFKSTHERWLALGFGAAIGFYDGFFGPGTGSFLIFIFIGLFGFDFLHASASAKIINFATNLAAILYFVWTGNVLYRYGIPMAICNVAGSLVGTRLAILKGNRFIRGFFLVIVSILIARVAYEMFQTWRIQSP